MRFYRGSFHSRMTILKVFHNEKYSSDIPDLVIFVPGSSPYELLVLPRRSPAKLDEGGLYLFSASDWPLAFWV